MYDEDDEQTAQQPPPQVPNRARALTYSSECRGSDKGYQRFNAFKHGMFARHLLVPGDDPGELHRFKIGMIKSLNPNDTFQQIVAERVICASWKLRRMEQAEQEMYHAEMSDPQNPAKTPGAAMIRMMKQGQPGMISEIERIQKYQQKLEGTMNRNLNLLHKLQTEGWHLNGVISELAAELIEEEESKLVKIDPEFQPQVLNSGWHNSRDPIHECVEKKKQADEQAQAATNEAPAEINSSRPSRPYLIPGGSTPEARETEPKAASWSPITNAELSDYLGKCAESWNKVDVADLKQRAKNKSTDQPESTRIAS